MYSEAVCTDHRARYCEYKDTRVGVSMSPVFIYDFGDELRVLYKSPTCMARSFSSYKDISSKNKLLKVLVGARVCHGDPHAEVEALSGHLDDFYAATRYMKERAEVVFGPINKRCWVKRSPTSNFPLSTNCPAR